MFLYRIFSYIEIFFSQIKPFLQGKKKKIDYDKFILVGKEKIFQEKSKRSLVVYAATIGEFHPARSFIATYVKYHPKTPIVLIVGQPQYLTTYAKFFPGAVILSAPRSPSLVFEKIFNHIKPKLVVYSEGPSLYCRFPIPLDLSIVANCLNRNIPLIIINACLYELHLQGRLEFLKYSLFRNIQKKAISHWFVPCNKFKDLLLSEKVPKDKITISGELKFDSAFSVPLPTKTESLDQFLNNLKSSDGPKIVIGSIYGSDELFAVFEAFLEVRGSFSTAQLIIAPRYVNNKEFMENLFELIKSQSLTHSLRSKNNFDKDKIDVVIVDVFGELPYIYSIADIAYIGRNHGVLEALRYKKPVVVAPDDDWKKDYAAYPLYNLMCEKKGIIQLSDKKEMGEVFLRLLNDHNYYQTIVECSQELVKENIGAAERIIKRLDKIKNITHE